MNKDDAFKLAFDIFKKELNSGISEARESKGYWCFFAGSNRMIGRPGIAVGKLTEDYFFLQMPDEKTKMALEDSKDIEVPSNFFDGECL